MMVKISAPWTFDPVNLVIYDRRHDYPILEALGPEAEAHGVLAAAAPDLQAALRELVGAIEKAERSPCTAFGDIDLEPELTGARAALARSEGKP